MKYVPKGRVAPEKFREIVDKVVSTPNHNGYNSLPQGGRPDLLKELMREQGYLCAYCNQVINDKNATVEHLVCQSHNAQLDLHYHNLFAVCRGNEGAKPEARHCDNHRANRRNNAYFLPFVLLEAAQTSSWHQLNPFFDVAYNPRTGVVSGRIVGKVPKPKSYPSPKLAIEAAIDVLNLNAPVLVEARKTAWEIVKRHHLSGKTWQELFEEYRTGPGIIGFREFLLLAIRKQEP
jgi:uncharacterized protein (TIGR02646 family)